MRGALLVLVAVGCAPALDGRADGPSANEANRSDAGRSDAETGREDRAVERRQLIREIENDARRTAQMTGRPRFAARVLEALERVPRHEFVRAGEQRYAYVNSPLPIGQGQTISQPYVVALMTDLLDPAPGNRILEIGTGSGYQAAVLAELVDAVYSVEIVEPLGRTAAERLERLGYDTVHVRIGDGWQGWPEHAPFDGIIVTAAAPSVPPPLLEQLAPGGRLVIPVRQSAFGEELTLITKADDGSLSRRGILPVRFVPLTGTHGDGTRAPDADADADADTDTDTDGR